MPTNDKPSGWTKYNPDFPERDRGILQVKNGRYTYQIEPPTELSFFLREKLAQAAKLDGAIRELPYIDVDMVVLWAISNTGQTVSKSTAEYYLQSQVQIGNLTTDTNNYGKKFYKRTLNFDEMNPLSKLRRESVASIEDLKKRGWKN